MAFLKMAVSSVAPSPLAPSARMLTQVSRGGSSGRSLCTGAGMAGSGVASKTSRMAAGPADEHAISVVGNEKHLPGVGIQKCQAGRDDLLDAGIFVNQNVLGNHRDTGVGDRKSTIGRGDGNGIIARLIRMKVRQGQRGIRGPKNVCPVKTPLITERPGSTRDHGQDDV